MLIILNKETGNINITGENPCLLCDSYKTCDKIMKLNCLVPCG